MNEIRKYVFIVSLIVSFVLLFQMGEGANIACSPCSAKVGEEVTCKWRNLNWWCTCNEEIDFGDGVTVNKRKASHTYQSPGIYTVKAKVCNKNLCMFCQKNNCETDEDIITVSETTTTSTSSTSSTTSTTSSTSSTSSTTSTSTSTTTSVKTHISCSPDPVRVGEEVTCKWENLGWLCTCKEKIDFGDNIGSERVDGPNIVEKRKGSHRYSCSGTYTVQAELCNLNWCSICQNNNCKTSEVKVHVQGSLCVEDFGNYPNPFSETTTFKADGTGIEKIRVKVYDLSNPSRKLFDSGVVSGDRYLWDGRDNNGNILANGVYLYTITAYGGGDSVDSKVLKLLIQREETTTTSTTSSSTSTSSTISTTSSTTSTTSSSTSTTTILKKPDLIISDFDPVSGGEEMEFRARAKNIGSGTVSENFYIDFYVYWSGEDHWELEGWVYVPNTELPLLPGEKTGWLGDTTSCEVTGYHKVKAVADGEDNEIDEENENNNKKLDFASCSLTTSTTTSTSTSSSSSTSSTSSTTSTTISTSSTTSSSSTTTSSTSSSTTTTSTTSSSSTTTTIKCPFTDSACGEPDGVIQCGQTKSGCLNTNDWKYYSVPDSAGKNLEVTLTYSGENCNINDLYIYNDECDIKDNVLCTNWVKIWSKFSSTDITIGLDGDSYNTNCQWELNVECLEPTTTSSSTTTSTTSTTSSTSSTTSTSSTSSTTSTSISTSTTSSSTSSTTSTTSTSTTTSTTSSTSSSTTTTVHYCDATKCDWYCCSKYGPCGEGEGDCDSDEECKPGLVCKQNVGKSYGCFQSFDVCEPEGTSTTSSTTTSITTSSSSSISTTSTSTTTINVLTCSAAKCDWQCCSRNNPCGKGEGDCDSDDECKSGLICKQDVGTQYGCYWNFDVCGI